MESDNKSLNIDFVQKAAVRYIEKLSIISSTLEKLKGDSLQSSIIRKRLITDLENEFYPVLQRNYKDIESDLNKLLIDSNGVSDDTDNECINLKDLIKAAKEETYSEAWLVLNTIPLGALIYLGGKAKIGKTDLIYNLMYCVTTGEDWLGIPVTKGNVVIFSLEENESSIRTKSRSHGYFSSKFLEGEDVDNVFMYKDLDLYNSPSTVRDKCIEHKPKLLIIDTARSALMHSPYEEKNPKWAEVFRVVQSYAIKYKCTIIVVHHFTKDDTTTSLFKLLAGTSNLAGIGEGAIGLFRNDNGESFLAFETRDVGTRKFNISRQRDPKTRKIKFQLLGVHGVSEDVVELKKSIIFLLMYKDSFYTEIKEYVKNHNMFETALSSLEDDQSILHREVDGHEEVQFYIEPTTKYYLSNSEEYKKISIYSEIANKLVKCTTKQDVLKVYQEYSKKSSSGKEEVNGAFSLLPKETALELKISIAKEYNNYPHHIFEEHPNAKILDVDLKTDEGLPIWTVNTDSGIIKC